MHMCTRTRNSYSHAHILQPLAFHVECGARVSWHLCCWTFELRHGYVYSCYSCHVLMFTHAPACTLKTSRRSINSQKWKKWLQVSTLGLVGEVQWSHPPAMSLFVFTLAFPGSHTLTAAPGGVAEQHRQRPVCMSQRADAVFSLPLCFCVLVRACRWILAESGSARYLHSAALLSGTVLVFGGNTHNDTSQSNGAKCFSADFLAYDVGESNFQTACLFIYFQSSPLWIFRSLSCDTNQTTRVSHVECLLRHSHCCLCGRLSKIEQL